MAIPLGQVAICSPAMQHAGWVSSLCFMIACAAPTSAPPTSPSPPVATEYAAARAQFHTHLTKHGPAVDGSQPYTMPDDAHAIEYTSDGLALRAWVSRIADGKRHPTVLFVHGGAKFGARHWQMTQPFRNAGFVVMMPLFRSENGLPGDYSMFYNEVDDVLAAADALAREPDVDPQRIYLAGHSSGASLALLAALASHRFRAVASFSGSPDFARLAALPGLAEFAPFSLDDPAEIRMRSSMEFAASFSCPVRLFWGDEEPGVADDNRGTLERGRAAGRDIDGIVVPGGHESMVGPATALAITFFQQH